jgi:hypothetical protein
MQQVTPLSALLHVPPLLQVVGNVHDMQSPSVPLQASPPMHSGLHPARANTELTTNNKHALFIVTSSN